MELTKDNLALEREKVYFRILTFFAALFWVGICITLVGIPIVGFLAFLGWLANGLFVAHLKSDCVHISEKQLPLLYQTYDDVCVKLGLVKIPELYIMQSHGLLNAFAMRHAGRNFVVIFSDVLESFGQDSDEIRFLLGHEIGHIARKHIGKAIFLTPAMFIPLIGSAYHRACEATCDRYGAFVSKDLMGAIRALMILSGGKEAGKTMDPTVFAQQSQTTRGFFVSWYELISGYPSLTQRIAFVSAIKNQVPIPHYPRHPLSYIFAFFTLGGGAQGSGNMMVTIMVVALLISIAIPNFLRAKWVANAKVAEFNLNATYEGLEEYAADHKGKYPTTLDVLVTSVPPVIAKNYCGKTIQDYIYTCELSETHYKITATPTEKDIGMEPLIIEGDQNDSTKSQGVPAENSSGILHNKIPFHFPNPGEM